MRAPSVVKNRGPRPGANQTVNTEARTQTPSASVRKPNHEPPEAEKPLNDSPARFSSTRRP